MLIIGLYFRVIKYFKYSSFTLEKRQNFDQIPYSLYYFYQILQLNNDT